MTATPSPPPTSAGSEVGVLYAASIFVCAAVGGGVPLLMQNRLGRYHAMDKGIVLGTIFGGGVFIASGFVHLLGDAAKELNTDEEGYPLAELWCAIGVLTPLCIDSVASVFAARARSMSGQQDAAAAPRVQPQAEVEIATSHRPNHRADADSLIKSLVLFDATDRPVHVVEDTANTASASSAAAAAATAGPVPGTMNGGSMLGRSPGRGPGRSIVVSIVGTIVLFLALTLHSFIAGLVLGIGGAMETGVFIAIIAHKSFAAWALGCALARTDRKQLSVRAAWLCLVGFALTTPIGVFIGMALREVSWVDGVVQHTLVALASGFFLYVGLMEVVAKELVNYQTKGSGVFAFLKLLMLVLGFTLMALLGLWV